jgi:hypothetical protein
MNAAIANGYLTETHRPPRHCSVTIHVGRDESSFLDWGLISPWLRIDSRAFSQPTLLKLCLPALSTFKDCLGKTQSRIHRLCNCAASAARTLKLWAQGWRANWATTGWPLPASKQSPLLITFLNKGQLPLCCRRPHQRIPKDISPRYLGMTWVQFEWVGKWLTPKILRDHI